MTKKILSGLLAACLMYTASAPAALALKSSFSDVTSPQYDWAIEDVESMTRIGIIKGYTDGTFRPANAIKKIEMLLLMARVAGYSNEDYAPYAEYASTLYAPVLAGYDLGDTYNRYKAEVSFLLYKGVISIQDLDSLLGEADVAVKRYEAAVLLTKLMGADDLVNNTAVVLDYTDYTSIPASARGYVEYVTNQGLMNGVGGNAFAPLDSVNRVQAAVLLRRIIDKLDYSTLTGTVTNVSSKSLTLSGSAGPNLTVSVNSGIPVTVDGIPSTLSDITKGDSILVLYSGNQVDSIEVITGSTQGSTVSGTLVDAEFEDDLIYLYVEDSNGEEHELLLFLDTKPRITLDGRVCTFDDLHRGLFAVVNSLEREIISITAYSSAPTAGSGKSDKNTGTGTKKPTVTKETISGIVSSIFIGSEPVIAVKTNGREKEYNVDPKAQIYIDDDDASLYDLRVGDSVELKLEDDIVISIRSSSVSSFRMSGDITYINIGRGYLDIWSTDGNKEERITIDDDTVIIDGVTGDALDLYDLEDGQNVTAVGSRNNGDLTAATILVLP